MTEIITIQYNWHLCPTSIDKFPVLARNMGITGAFILFWAFMLDWTPERSTSQIIENHRLLVPLLTNISSAIDDICEKTNKRSLINQQKEAIMHRAQQVCLSGIIPDGWLDVWCTDKYIRGVNEANPSEYEHPNGLMFVSYSNRFGYIPIPRTASSTGRQWVQRVREAELRVWGPPDKEYEYETTSDNDAVTKIEADLNIKRKKKRGLSDNAADSERVQRTIKKRRRKSRKKKFVKDDEPPLKSTVMEKRTPQLTVNNSIGGNQWGMTLKKFLQPPFWKDMFVFAVVRDPMTRFWSGWREICKYGSSDRGYGKFSTDTALGSLDLCGAGMTDRYLIAALENMVCGNDFNIHLTTQYTFLHEFIKQTSSNCNSDEHHLDTVFPLEDLGSQVDSLAQRIGYPHEVHHWQLQYNAGLNLDELSWNSEIPAIGRDLWCLLYLPDYVLLKHLYKAPEWCDDIYSKTLKHEARLLLEILHHNHRNTEKRREYYEVQ